MRPTPYVAYVGPTPIRADAMVCSSIQKFTVGAFRPTTEAAERCIVVPSAERCLPCLALVGRALDSKLGHGRAGLARALPLGPTRSPELVGADDPRDELMQRLAPRQALGPLIDQLEHDLNVLLGVVELPKIRAEAFV